MEAPTPLHRRKQYRVHLIETYLIDATTEENAVAQAECGLFDPDTVDVQVEEVQED